MKKNKSFRFQLTFSTSLIIMSFIGIFSLILLVYMTYYLLIIGKIYTMAEDVMTPIASIIILLLFILAITALISSIICGITISDKYLKTVNKFNNNVKQIKKDGLKHRLQIEGNDELGQLGKEFNDVLDQLETSLNQQNQFVSDASHELKTPLAIIKGNLDMLLRWGKDDPEILNSSLEISSKEADRLIMLCNELLHLTREMKVKCKEAINIIPIINQIIKEFEELHPDFTFTITIDSDKKIWITEEHLRQLLIILLDNAVKYSKADSKKIELKFINYELKVKDYGIGIEESKINYIFNRFYKTDESRVKNSNSFGLGLAIAKRLCDHYGFKISVISKLNEYSEFTINFKKEEENDL